jgi:rubredoxin
MKLYRCPCCGLVYAFEPTDSPCETAPERRGCACETHELLVDITEALGLTPR